MQTAFLFDLDGTLVDSVYQHVLAWREALETEGIDLSVWRVHRKIGMSGGLLTNILLRETQVDIDPARVERLQRLHAEAYKRNLANVQAAPGRHRPAHGVDQRANPVGDRHQRATRNGCAGARETRGGSQSHAGHHARPGEVRQA